MQPRHPRRRSARPVVVVLLTLGVAVGLGLAVGPPRRVTPAATSGGPVVEVAARPVAGTVAEAASVLRAWDRRRAAAWARGSVGALRRLYVAGAGAPDVRLLRDYLDRGLRVHGMRTQLLAVDVLARRPDRWRLRVTDRLAAAVVVGDGIRRGLPRDEATTRVLVLVRAAAGWQVAAVRQA